MNAGSNADTVSLAMQRQQRSEWCWAAVSVSVDRFFRPKSTHTQCDIASLVLGLQCCGPSAPSDQCNTPHELHKVLGSLHLLAAEPILKPLTFQAIQKEVDAGRPVCALIRWLDSQGKLTPRGHFLAIGGYRVTPAQRQFLNIADPIYGSSEIDYGAFSDARGGYHDGHGVWFASFLVQNVAKP